MKNVLEYINNNDIDTIDVDSICQYFGISQKTFLFFFKEANGKSFYEYVSSIKKEKVLAATIKDFIDNNIGNGLKLQDIYDTFCTKRKMAQTIFNKYIGMSIYDYYQIARMNYASKMLADSNMAIDIIAQMVGVDLAHFASIFKEVYGCTPTSYRLKLKKPDENC